MNINTHFILGIIIGATVVFMVTGIIIVVLLQLLKDIKNDNNNYK